MDDCLVAFENYDKKEILNNVIEFIKKNETTFDLKEPLNKKKKFVQYIFKKLIDPSESENYCTFLQAIRIVTRDKNDLDVIFTNEKLNTMLHLARLVGEEEAFMTENSKEFDTKVVTESQRCICNLIFNCSKIQKLCCDNSYIDGIMLRLKMYKDPQLPTKVKYFDMRMLFILTALCQEVRVRVSDDYHGFVYLMEVIDLILKQTQEHSQRSNKIVQKKRINYSHLDESDNEFKSKTKEGLDNLSVDLCCEVLKVLYNLTFSIDKNNVDDVEEAHFIRLVGILHDLLLIDTKNEEKRFDLQNHTINLLNNIPPSCYEELLVPIHEVGKLDNPKYEYQDVNVEAIAVLLQFLDRRLDANYDDTRSMHEYLSPVLVCMCEMSRVSSVIRKYLKSEVLPPLKDVTKRPEEGSTLRNKLVKLMTAPNTHIKELVAEFMFILCKENVERLIKYTGYGNAAGLLANRGLMLGNRGKSQILSDSEDSDTEEYLKVKNKINPVTGCYEESKVNIMDTLTEEEKEAEAMNLVKMIDELQKTGVVKPCRIGEDGKPVPIKHILELRGYKEVKDSLSDESDSD